MYNKTLYYRIYENSNKNKTVWNQIGDVVPPFPQVVYLLALPRSCAPTPQECWPPYLPRKTTPHLPKDAPVSLRTPPSFPSRFMIPLSPQSYGGLPPLLPLEFFSHSSPWALSLWSSFCHFSFQFWPPIYEEWQSPSKALALWTSCPLLPLMLLCSGVLANFSLESIGLFHAL